jgi:hypothetical protein
MRNFLTSKNTSGACAVINGVIALCFFIGGNGLLALVSAGFCVLCTRNYLVA